MPPRDLSQIKAAFKDSMFEMWLRRIGWSEAQFDSMYLHGVPAEWAETIASITGGAVAVEHWPNVIASPRVLRRHDTNDTVTPMDVNTQHAAEDVKRGAARATRKHKALKRLYEKGRTVTSLATELGEGRPRVSAWFAEGTGNRPIPRRHAETLRDRYGIPLGWWTRVAD